MRARASSHSEMAGILTARTAYLLMSAVLMMVREVQTRGTHEEHGRSGDVEDSVAGTGKIEKSLTPSGKIGRSAEENDVAPAVQKIAHGAHNIRKSRAVNCSTIAGLRPV